MKFEMFHYKGLVMFYVAMFVLCFCYSSIMFLLQFYYASVILSLKQKVNITYILYLRLFVFFYR